MPKKLALTEQEIEFCEHYARVGNGSEAVRLAGYPGNPKKHAQISWVLKQRADIQKAIQTAQNAVGTKARKRAQDLQDDRREFLHYELIHRLRRAKTHPIRGDADIAKMLETGMRSTGDIAPTSVTNSNSATANAQSLQNATAFQVYEGKWMAARNANWDKELTEKHAQLPAPSNPNS